MQALMNHNWHVLINKPGPGELLPESTVAKDQRVNKIICSHKDHHVLFTSCKVMMST